MTENGWQPIESAPEMTAIMLHHPYYSAGQVRIGFQSHGGEWHGVDARGDQYPELLWEPTAWMPIPEPPSDSAKGEG